MVVQQQRSVSGCIQRDYRASERGSRLLVFNDLAANGAGTGFLKRCMLTALPYVPIITRGHRMTALNLDRPAAVQALVLAFADPYRTRAQ